MIKEIKLLTTSTDGQARNYLYQPGGKHRADARTIYKILVDGKEQLPVGTKIYRKGNSVIFEFPQGEIFEITDWCSVTDSKLVELVNGQALVHGGDQTTEGKYTPLSDLESGACLIYGESGQSIGTVGELGGQAGAAAAGGGFSPIMLAPLALLGLAGGGGGGGGGGDGGGGGGTRPAKPSGKLASTSDSGIQGDDTTNDNTPTISGTGGTPGNTIELRDASGNLLGSATVQSDGSWSITPASALADGDNVLSLVAKDSSGRASDPQPLTITIDTGVPSAPGAAPDMTPATDTGSSNADELTRNSRPGFVIDPPAAGFTPVLLVDGVEVPSVFDAATNTISPLNSISPGSHTISTALRDVAGNTSAPSGELPIQITPVAALDPSSDSGTLGDLVTTDRTPNIQGFGTPGDTITVTFPGGEVKTVTITNPDGSWQVTPTQPLPDGLNPISIVATDPDGNTTSTTTLNLTVDATAPSAPTIAAIPESVSGGAINATEAADGTVIQVNIPADAVAGDVLTLNVGGVPVLYTVQATDVGTTASVTVDASVLAALSDGSVSVLATITDSAGNTSAASAVATLTLDRNAPNAPSIAAIPENAGGGINTVEAADGTAIQVSIPGTAQAGDTLTLNVGGQSVTYTVQAGDVGSTASVPVGAGTLASLADGAITVTATLTDQAGNTSAPSAPFDFILDRGAPSAPAAAPDLLATSDSGSSDTDNNTADTTPSFSITAPEAGETPSLYVDGVKVAATFDALTNTLTPTTPLADGSRTITTTLTDASGNESVQSPALPMVVDTADPTAPAAPDMTADTDTGPSDSDNLTSDATPTFTGSSATAGETITLYVDGVAVGTGVVDASGNWSITPTDPIADGAHNATITTTDLAGNESGQSATLPIVIDTTATAAPSIAAIPENAGGGINAAEAADGTTIQVSISDTAQAGDTLTLSVGGQSVTYTVLAGDVGGTASVPVGAGTLAALTDGTITVTATLTDQAGNVSAPSAPFDFILDRGAPSAPTALDLIAASDSGASDIDNITSDTTPTITGDPVESGATVTLYDSNGTTVLGTTVADVAGNWSITPSAPLADGVHSFTVKQTDLGGNQGPASTVLAVTIDTTAPAAPPAPDMTDVTDSGSNNSDNNTSNTTPTFAGTGAAPGETITLFVDGTPVGTAVVGGSGNWSIIPANPLADGAHSVTVTATDAAGNTSPQSAALPIVIDTAAPSAPAAPDMTAATDSGSSNVDNHTSDTTPSFAVPAPALGETPNLYVDGVLVPSTFDTLTNTLTPTGPIPAGAHNITTTVTDAAGNESAQSPALPIEIDTGGPSAPTALDLATSSDTGSSATDDITSDTTPTITGAPVEAGATVTLYDSNGTTVLGTTVADAAGNWSITSSVLPDGVHTFTVTQTDLAGNVSAVSSPLPVTVDTTAPAAPAAPDMTAATDSGGDNTDDTTSDTTPSFTISAPAAGGTAQLYVDGVLVPSTFNALDNTLTPANPITDGAHDISYTLTDAAGNESAQSINLPIVIDTTAPTAPSIFAIPENSGGGVTTVEQANGTTIQITIPADAHVGDTLTLDVDGQIVVHEVALSDIGSIASVTIQSAVLAALGGTGVHPVTATLTDAAGNVSAPSSPFPLVLTNVALTSPIVADVPENAGGGINAAEASDGTTVTVDITGAQSGAGAVAIGDTLRVTINGVDTDIVLGVSTGTVNVAIPAGSLPAVDGPYNVTAVILASGSGLAGAVSPDFPIILDRAAPVAPAVAPDMTAGTDTGGENTDNNTLDTTPSFEIPAPGPGETAKLYVNGAPVAATFDSVTNTLTPITPLAEGTYTITYTLTDLAGNESGPSPGLVNVVIDTTAPLAPVAPDMTAATDSGSSNSDNTTSDTTPSFTVTAPGVAETPKLYVDGVLVAITFDSGTNTLTPVNPLPEGAHNVTWTITDAAGNESPQSPALAIVIDTIAPNAPAAPDMTTGSDTGSSATDNNTANATPTFSGTGTAGETITLYVDGTPVGSAVVAGDGTWSITPATPITEGSHNVTATTTDSAGNESAPSPALPIVIDVTAPAAPTALDLTNASDTGVSNTDDNTGDTTPTVTGAPVGAGFTVTLYDTDGITVLGTTVADATGNWSITSSALTDGIHNFTVKQTDLAGNQSAASAPLAVTIDTTAPSAPAVAPDMTSETDTGSSNTDDRTGDSTPTFAGTGSVGETITLYVDGSAVGTAVVDGTGNWSITPSTTLGDGTHNVTSTTTDAAGNESVQSAALPILIDTTAPSAPTVIAVPENSNGGVNATEDDNGTVIQVSIPTDAQAGDTLTLNVGGQSVTYTILAGDVGATANVNVPATTLDAIQPDGTYAVTAMLTDAAGNVSATSPAFNFTLDRAAPTIPAAAPDMTAGTDSGASNSDNVTGDTTPSFAIAAPAAGETPKLYIDGVLVPSNFDAGTNTLTPVGPIADGPHIVTYTLTDVAGNQSAPSPGLPITIDTTQPSAPIAPDMTAATDSGSSDTDNTTKDTTPTFTSTGTVGETITLYVDGTAVGTAVVDPTGNWSITPSAPIADGSHNVTATTTDAAGNESAQSAALPIVIDTTAPSAPNVTAIPENSNGGINTSEDNDGTVIQVAIPADVQAGDTLTLNVGGQTVTHTVLAGDVGSTANVTVAAATLDAIVPDGTYTVTATVTDAAGNTSAPSPAFNFTLDRTAPNPPVIAAAPENAGGGINAVEGSDGTTIGITLPVGTQAGDALHLTVGGNVVNYVVTAGDVIAGTSNVPVSAAVLAAAVAPSGSGTVNLTATITDLAGNTSAPSAAFPISLDLDGPGAAEITAVPENTQGGINVTEAADGTVVNISLAGTGAAEGDTLTLDWGGFPVTYTLTATDIANDTAAVPVSALTIATRGSGTFDLTTTLTDVAGNVSPESVPFTVKVDVVPPFAPTITAIPEASGGGLNAAEAADGTPIQVSLAGTEAETGDIVHLNWGGQLVDYTLTATDIANGGATITISSSVIGAAGDGTIPVVVASITDVAGNAGPNSVPFSVVVDTTPLAAPTITSIPDNAGGGISATEDDDGALVNVSLPTGTVAGDIVTLSFGGQTITHTVLSTEATGGSVAIFVSQAILQTVAGGPTGTASNVPVTATVTDQAGNVSAPSANSPVNIDLAGPAALIAPDLASASDTGPSNTDNITADTTPTLQGTTAEPGAIITLYDSDGITVLGTTVADGTGVWSIAPAIALPPGVHNFTVTQTDTAGNVGPISPALAVTIVTAPPVPGTPDMTAATDSGSSNSDNLTSDNTPDFAVAGTDGNTINVFVDVNGDGAFNPGDIALGSAVVVGGIATITANSALSNGSYSIRATQTDLAGNTSAAGAALNITIDTVAPSTATPALDLIAADDTGASNTDNATSKTSYTVNATGLEPGATVQLKEGATVIATTTVGAGGTATFSVAGATEGAHAYSVTQTDAAGNASTTGTLLSVTVDTTAPGAAPQPDMEAASDSGSSNTDNITNDSTPTFSQPAATAPAGVTQVAVYVDGVRTLINVNGDGSFSFTPSSALANGTHTIEMAYVDAAGNEGAKSATLNFTIDTLAPSANVPDLISASDNGSSSTDNLTSNNTPTLTVAGTEGSSVQIFADVNNDGVFNAGDINLGTATVTGGVATVTTATLADGVYNVRTIETDVAGNVSAASGALSVTIDTTAPTVPAPDMTAATDTGSSNTDNITGDSTPTFTLPAGSAQTGDTVQLLVNNSVVAATVTVNGDGSVTATPTGAIADGSNIPVAFRITDAAGNVGTSSNLNITVDTSAPLAPPTPDLAAASDSGSSNTDNITNNTTPLIQGTGALANATVTLYDSDGVTVIGMTTANGSGAWSLTPSVALGAGVHNFTVKQTDPAGNQSAASTALAVTIDTAGPSLSDPAAVNEGFASITLNSTTLSGTDNVSASGALEVISAVFKSSSTFVAGDFSFGAPSGGAITVTRSGGADKNGTVIMTVQMRDAAGNITTQDITVSVTAVNDAPAGADKTVGAVEDTVFTFNSNDFGFSDPVEGNTLQGVKITTAPGAGTLFLDANANGALDSGEAIAAGTTVSATDISGNKLRFIGASNANGSPYTSFTFQVQDNGGTANGGVDLDPSANTITVNVTAVNDAPTLDASKSPALSTPEYVFSGGGDAGVHAPSGASPTGSVLVSALIDYASPSGQVDNASDVDASPSLGLGVTALSANLGTTLWYTTNGGTTWNWTTNTGDSAGGKGLFGADGLAGGGDDRVLLLAADVNTKIVYDGGGSGSLASLANGITFRAWDQTTGSGGGFLTNPSTGGSNALSSATDTVQVNFTSQAVDLTRLDGVAGVAIVGGTANAKFGWDVSTAGDVNGDGFDDFVISENGVAATGKGAAYIFYGQATPLGSATPTGQILNAASGAAAIFTRATAGESMTGVTNLGDLNADGFADFMISGDSGTSGSGSAYVVFGGNSLSSITNLDSTSLGGSWFRISSPNGGIGLNNHTISWVGDVNGDGYEDLIFGTPLADTITSGSASNVDAGASFVVYGHSGANFGASNNLNVSSIFSSAFDLISDTGGVAGHVLEATTNTRGLITFAGTAASRFGDSVSGLGDRNGDGYADYMATIGASTAAGANGYELHGNLTQANGGNITWTSGSFSPAPAGSNQVGAGTGTAVNNARIRITGPGSGTFPPTEPDRVNVDSVGDLNGDGLSDFAMTYNWLNNGDVYVGFGNTTILNDALSIATLASGTTGFKIAGAAAGDRLGESIRSIGDFNGDGYDDLIVGAPRNELGTATDQGGAYIIYGGTALAGSTINLSTTLTPSQGLYIRGPVTGDQAGFSVGSAGDVNGDGLDDLLIGAPLNDGGATNAGTTYLIYGSNAYGNNSAQTVAAFNAAGNTAAAEKVIGTSGADIVTGSGIGSGDAISTGAGNDLIVTNATTFLRIDGGTGTDTLRLSGVATWDFTSTANLSGKVRGTEIIDLGTGNQTLRLNAQDVLNMSEVTNDLRVTGTAGDTIDLSEVIGTGASQWHNLGTVSGVTTYQYFDSSNAATLARLLADSTVTVS